VGKEKAPVSLAGAYGRSVRLKVKKSRLKFATAPLAEVTRKLREDTAPKTVEKVTEKKEPYALNVQSDFSRRRLSQTGPQER
jgi:hypothetical protein